MPRIRRALVSVSDKRGIIPFVRALQALGVECISTGGTATLLRENGLTVTTVSTVTGFPEILGGRVKTLHPAIHAALLAIDDNPEHQQQMQQQHITPIEMVVANLYPFQETVAREGVSLNEAVEQIDIGGPTMIRAAAKNYRHRAVVVNPDTYDPIIEEMRAHDGMLSEDTCWNLARDVFRHTAMYDTVISHYLDAQTEASPKLPDVYQLVAQKEMDLRYGENPHQRAALYGSTGSVFRHLHGKELSFNNIVDMTAAALCAAEFDEPTVAIIKHTNPCGIGSASDLVQAYTKAFATDTKSPFGGIVAVNRPIDVALAERINQVFTEVVIAPGYAEDALEVLRKKKDRRLIQVGPDLLARHQFDLRSVPGGFLVQSADLPSLGSERFDVVTQRHPTEGEARALRFAWRVAKHVKSNAIVYAAEDRTLGIGAGQMSRIDSAKLAVIKAEQEGLSLKGSVVGSDAFFPFADGLLEAIRAGATAVIQPGGSIRDDEVIRAANDNNIAMVFTGTRHFRH